LRRTLALLLLAGCATPGPASRDVNLLTRIDTTLGAVEGQWTSDGPALVTPNAKFARLQVWYVPPEEYDLRVVAERVEGTNSIVLGLVFGSRRFMVAIDALYPNEVTPRSGIELIDGKSIPDNETNVDGRQFENGKRSTIVASVRRQSVVVTVDGRKLIDWKADYARVGIHVKWKMTHPQALWLGAFTSVYRVHELTLVPVTGEGRALD